jgi:hypothetical protein
MDRLAAFRPHLGGAVWRGTATRLSNIVIDLYCDDPKSAEIAFLNEGLDFDSGSDDPDTVILSTVDRSRDLPEPVTLHFVVHDHDDLRGPCGRTAAAGTGAGMPRHCDTFCRRRPREPHPTPWDGGCAGRRDRRPGRRLVVARTQRRTARPRRPLCCPGCAARPGPRRPGDPP